MQRTYTIQYIELDMERGAQQQRTHPSFIFVDSVQILLAIHLGKSPLLPKLRVAYNMHSDVRALASRIVEHPLAASQVERERMGAGAQYALCIVRSPVNQWASCEHTILILRIARSEP